MLYTKYQGSSRLRQKIMIQCKIVTPEAESILTPGHNLNNSGRGPLDNVIYKYKSSGPFSFRQDF